MSNLEKSVEENKRGMVVAILSLSLLTVMAGAAVAPALNVIKEYFADSSAATVQMIISMPALFIVITNLLFPKMCKYLKTKSLLMIGLFLYTFGGALAGCFNSIYLVLTARALVGIGVGIIMPLSTGLLSFYYPPERQEKLMGLSSAMNQMGGVVATLIAGFLATISWRASFLVYFIGLISIILCLLFTKNDVIHSDEASISKKSIKDNSYFIISMFLLMVTFFIYPANFAIETVADKVIPQSMISIIMAGMDLCAFCGGLMFVHLKKHLKKFTRFLAPLFFLLGYLFLEILGGWCGTIIGSLLIGFANGEGIPFIIATASKKAGKLAATTVMPLISASLYLAQFLTPMLVSFISNLFGSLGITHLPYWIATITAILFFFTSSKIKDSNM